MYVYSVHVYVGIIGLLYASGMLNVLEMQTYVSRRGKI